MQSAAFHEVADFLFTINLHSKKRIWCNEFVSISPPDHVCSNINFPNFYNFGAVFIALFCAYFPLTYRAFKGGHTHGQAINTQ